MQELLRASAAENNLTANLAAEVTRATAAEATKEVLVNKSTNVTTDGASDIKYPSVKSVKTYVDAAVAAATTAVTNEATIRAAADATLTTNLAAEVTNRANADLLKENISIEVTGDEKPWNKDVEIKTDVDTELISKLTDYINEEVKKSNLILLEKMRLSYYNNNILDSIENEIKNIRKIYSLVMVTLYQNNL